MIKETIFLKNCWIEIYNSNHVKLKAKNKPYNMPAVWHLLQKRRSYFSH